MAAARSLPASCAEVPWAKAQAIDRLRGGAYGIPMEIRIGYELVFDVPAQRADDEPAQLAPPRDADMAQPSFAL